MKWNVLCVIRSWRISCPSFGWNAFQEENKADPDLFVFSGHFCEEQQQTLVSNWDFTSMWADSPVHQKVISTFMKKTQWAVGKAFSPYIILKKKQHIYSKNKQLKFHKIQRKAEQGIYLIISNHKSPDIY